LREEGRSVAALRFTKPRTEVRIRMDKGEPVFDLDVKAAASIIELWEMKSEKTFEQMASRHIQEQIRKTYQYASSVDVDVYDLEHLFYRKRYKEWNRITSGGKIPLRPIRFGDVRVDVRIVQSGMYKMKRKMNPY